MDNNNNNNKSKLISIEGNIGSGKTTLLNCFKYYYNQFDIHVETEPLDIWDNFKEDDQSILSLFYNDKKKYSYIFQNIIFYTMINKRIDTLKYPIVLNERSISASRYIFSEMLHDVGDMTDIQFQTTDLMYNTIVKSIPSIEPDIIIYLDIKPEVCYKRIKERGRSGEDMISIDYLYDIEYHYKNYLTLFKNNDKKVLELKLKDDELYNIEFLNNLYQYMVNN